MPGNCFKQNSFSMQRTIYQRVSHPRHGVTAPIRLLVLTGFIFVWLLSSAAAVEKLPRSAIERALEMVGPAVSETNYTCWGSSPIFDEDGKVHLFVARWPESNVDPAWRKSSEIAHYAADRPEGPFQFHDVALRGTGADTWDKFAPSNPEIHKFGDTYALLHIANDDYHQPPHPRNQRIGLALARSLVGPWRKAGRDGLILESSRDTNHWTYGSQVVNPTMIERDGKFLLYFKSRCQGQPGLVYGLAVADKLEGPYVIQGGPLTKKGVMLEDASAFVWQDRVCLLTTDNHGEMTGIPGGGTLWVSEDGRDFNPAWTQIGFDRISAYFKDYDPKKATHFYGPNHPKFERPKVLMRDGEPAFLYAASGINVYGGPRTAVYVLRINLASGAGPLPGRKRVACIGDSITFGAGTKPREQFSYPAQLSAMLGDDYEVRNFGVGSSTLLMAGDKPYGKQPQFQAALDFDPDIVVVMLGVNDTCGSPRGNWEKSAAFLGDARELLHAFQRPGRRVIIALPTPMLPTTPGLKPERKADLEARRPRLEQVRDWWREAAGTEHAEVVDLSTSLEPDTRFVTDGVHPTAAGYTKVAQSVKEQIIGGASSRHAPSAKTTAPSDRFMVMSFNILEAGGDAPSVGFPDTHFGGSRRDDVANVIRECGADIVGVQECGSVELLLKELGPEWHGFGNGHSTYTGALVSKFPLEPLVTEDFLTAARVKLPGINVVVVNCHWWPPKNSGAALIQQRLRDGKIPADLAKFESEILAASDASNGPRGYLHTLKALRPHLQAGQNVILTGDFNESSHLDWTARAAESGLDRWVKNPTGHSLRFKMDWKGSKLLADAGMNDAYRSMFPDEVAKPGITWTPPYADGLPGRSPYGEQVLERIDRIYFAGQNLELASAAIVGESKEHCETVHSGPWVSDHRATAATFVINLNKQP